MFTNLSKKKEADQEITDEILKEYEKRTIEILFDIGDEGTTSRAAWELLTEQGITISRASVINFLNTLVDQNLIKYTEEPGKGGMKGVYSPFMGDTLDGLYTRICFDLMEQMKNEFKGANLVWCALNLKEPDQLLSNEERETVTNALRNTLSDDELIQILSDKIKHISLIE